MANSLPTGRRSTDRRLTIAVDAAFALSPYGLLAVMALANTAQVYVPRSLLGLLDNHEAYRRRPQMLAGPAWQLPAAKLESLAHELEAWRRAWHFGRLAARVHWIGDFGYESMPADREDNGLQTRFEWCAASFDTAFQDILDFSAPLDACARDALALVAAVQPDPVLLLSVSEDGTVPPLCAILAGGGLGVAAQDRPPGFAAPLSATQSVLELAGASMLEILVPGALALPSGWNPEEEWEIDDDRLFSRDVWSHAHVNWHTMRLEKRLPPSDCLRERAA